MCKTIAFTKVKKAVQKFDFTMCSLLTLKKQSPMNQAILNTEEIIIKYKPLVVKAVCKIVKNKMDAEEVVNDALLKALDKFRLYQTSKGSFEAWLCTLAKNTALDFINKKDYRVWKTSTDKIPDLASKIEIYDRRLGLCKKLLNGTLNEPNDLESLTIKLLYLENNKYEEIAENLNINIEYTRVLKHRAITKFRKIALCKAA